MGMNSSDLQAEADRLRALSDADFAQELRLSCRYTLVLRRAGYPDRRITIPTLSDALAAARVDAAWLRGIGSVLISPVLYAARVPQKG